MNEIDDRLGALTRALEDRFPDSGVPPLRLPARDELAGRPRRRRQVRGWLAPLAAAAAVIAVVAGSLVITHGMGTSAHVPGSAAASSWTIQPTPSPKGNYLAAVSCYAGDTCLAAGGTGPGPASVHGLIEQRQDGIWKKLDLSLDRDVPEAVSCTSAPSCLVVGMFYSVANGAKEWAMQWSGGHWTAVQPTSVPPETSILTGASCLSDTDCVAVGWVATTQVVAALAQRWDGSHWTTLAPPRPAGAVQVHLYGVSCPTTTDCTTVGWYSGKDQKEHPIAARWNGEHWVIQKPPVPGSAAGGLSAVSCVSASDCTAVGYDTVGGKTGPLADSWNGHAWTEQAVGPAGATLTGISCVSASSCTAVGYSRRAALADYWNGSNWTVQPTAPPAANKSLSSVSCASSGTCTAVGLYANGNALAEHE
jgi:hypothetical protein